MSPVELSDERRRGWSQGAELYDRNKAWLSINNSILSGNTSKTQFMGLKFKHIILDDAVQFMYLSVGVICILGVSNHMLESI